MPCTVGSTPVSIEACPGSVFEGKIVCAENEYAPRATSAQMFGVFSELTASARRPSIEMSATRGGGGGVGVGVGTATGVEGTAEGWVRLFPQALASAAATSTPLAATHRRERRPPSGSAISGQPLHAVEGVA
jgi:hypothetical protein